MAVEEFPDPENHRLCSGCMQWFYPDDVTVAKSPTLLGTLLAFPSAVGRLLSGNHTRMQLVCFECAKKRTFRPFLWLAWLLVIAGLIGLFMVLYGIEWLRNML
jgi:hypothetical protein